MKFLNPIRSNLVTLWTGKAYVHTLQRLEDEVEEKIGDQLHVQLDDQLCTQCHNLVYSELTKI